MTNVKCTFLRLSRTQRLSSVFPSACSWSCFLIITMMKRDPNLRRMKTEEGWPTAKHKFDAVVFWLSGNECDDKDKEFISNRLDFDHFIGEELLTDVRISGLFSDKMIH